MENYFLHRFREVQFNEDRIAEIFGAFVDRTLLCLVISEFLQRHSANPESVIQDLKFHLESEVQSQANKEGVSLEGGTREAIRNGLQKGFEQAKIVYLLPDTERPVMN